MIGASIGPIPLGMAFDLIDDYTLTLVGLAILPALVGILTQFLKEPKLAPKEIVN